MIHDEPLSLFAGDGLHRLLVRLRLESAAQPDLWRRTVYGILVTWVPIFILAGLSGNLFYVVPDSEAGIGNPPPFAPGGLVPRDSFLMDLASMAQFLGFFPLAFFAEGFIGVKILGGLDCVATVYVSVDALGLEDRSMDLLPAAGVAPATQASGRSPRSDRRAGVSVRRANQLCCHPVRHRTALLGLGHPQALFRAHAVWLD